MVSWENVKDAIVTLCAVAGAVLGVINFLRARSKERKDAKQELMRANQNLVKAAYRKAKTDTGLLGSELHIINADTRPVTGLHVDFFSDADGGKPVLSKDVSSMRPNEDISLWDGPQKAARLKHASFVYTDADGNPHRYTTSIEY